MTPSNNHKNRCSWANAHPLYIPYHDTEWGVPTHDDRLLFEFLTLSGMQAGLSWLTILKRRENYRCCFDDFQVDLIAAYDEEKVDHLLTNPGIIRNRLKVRSVINNAKAVLEAQKEWGSFSKYLWHFVNGSPIQNRWKDCTQIPAISPLSDTVSKDLKKRGFQFVGSTICYSFLQSVGLINDHTVDCFCYAANF